MKNIFKTKLITLISAGFIMILATIGCVKLEETPMDFPGPDNYYNTPEQIVAALAGSMSRLYIQWDTYSYEGWWAFESDQTYWAALDFSASHANWLWRAHYRSTAILNSIVGALNEDRLGSQVSQNTKDELMAQATFVRAFNYFCLVRCYGDVPLITEDTDLVGDVISRDPSTDVYAFIISDLQTAIDGLPESWPDYPGRPSADAARSLLAKVYMTMATAPLKATANAQNARDMAKSVMDNGVHYMVEDVNDVFKLENKFGPEMMWGFNATIDDIATPPQIWLPETMADGWGDFGVAQAWFLQYPDQPRRDAYLIMEDWDGASWEEWTYYGAPFIRKFAYDDRETLERLQSTANIPIIRYADVLLIFAEAENMVNSGPTQAAVDALNEVINRANGGVENPEHPLATTSMSQTEFDAAVIQERNLELFFEYDRWYDLIRKEMLCDVWVDRPDVEVNCDPNDYLFPIPHTELRLNENLVQNPGYTSPE